MVHLRASLAALIERRRQRLALGELVLMPVVVPASPRSLPPRPERFAARYRSPHVPAERVTQHGVAVRR